MPGQLRVLVVEDTPDDAELMILALKEGGLIPIWERVDSAEGLAAALATKTWDAVLSDYTLPAFGAAAALEIVRGVDSDLPFLVVSGTVGEEVAVEMMRVGANDYVLKQNLTRLAPAIDRELREAENRRSRVRALDTIRANEERYHALVDASAAIVWDSPASGEFDSHQAGWTAFTGQTFDQHRGWGWLNVVHPDDREKSTRAWTAAVAGKIAYTIEHRLRRADGEYRQMFVRAVPIFEPGGAIREWVGVHTDVTEQRRSEDALRETEQRLKHVLASSPAVIFKLALVANQIRGISWISENLMQMLGYSPELAIGSNWWLENIHPDDRKSVVSRTGEQIFRHGYVTHEYRFKHRDGSYRWTRDEIRLIRDADGLPLEAVGSWSDITDRKLLEEKFRQAHKMEAFGQLAGGIAHDFNNLITIINGYSGLVLRDPSPNDTARGFVAEIIKAGERAAALTRQLLAFSRKQLIVVKLLDLNTIVGNIEKMLRRIIGEDIELVTSLSKDIDLVRADAGQLEQVLLNLAVNARDAMPRGGKLTIETKNIELDENYASGHINGRTGPFVLLAASDSGCGMTQEVKARIFEPFFTTKGVGEGTGLGLATVYGIVKQAGGHVEVYSEVNVGTSFKIYLPRANRAMKSADDGESSAPVLRGTESILLVEDEPSLLGLLQQTLMDFGYSVSSASSGNEALRSFQNNRKAFDLIVTDVVMPIMGGRQMVEQFVADHPKVKVLYMSGYTDDAVVRHGILHEQVAYLQKPFSPAAFARKVREVLDS